MTYDNVKDFFQKHETYSFRFWVKKPYPYPEDYEKAKKGYTYCDTTDEVCFHAFVREIICDTNGDATLLGLEVDEGEPNELRVIHYYRVSELEWELNSNDNKSPIIMRWNHEV